MNPTELNDRLLQIKDAKDFDATEIVEELRANQSSLEHVDAILRFMEQNPSVDFGTPGPLVHFVETFYKRGYEALLLESVSRKPTSHTIWMLNRILNGTKDSGERERLLSALRLAEAHPLADDETKSLIARFLQRAAS